MPGDWAWVGALLRPYFQHFDGEHNEGHTPHFYCFSPLPGVFSFSEPDGAPWVLRLLRAGVRAGHGREGSHLDLLPCKEDLSLKIEALPTRGALSICSLKKVNACHLFKAENRIENLCPLCWSHCMGVPLSVRDKCVPKS